MICTSPYAIQPSSISFKGDPYRGLEVILGQDLALRKRRLPCSTSPLVWVNRNVRLESDNRSEPRARWIPMVSLLFSDSLVFPDSPVFPDSLVLADSIEICALLERTIDDPLDILGLSVVHSP